LVKDGDGTLTLSNAGNTYSGPTTVDGGTLAGFGAVDSDLTVNSATLAPGVGVGTFNAKSATFSAGATLDVGLDGADPGKLLAAGPIDLAGCSLSVTVGNGGVTQQNYVIAEGSSLTGTFGSVPSDYRVSYNGTQAILSRNYHALLFLVK
ncbi:MAG: autotransporter-associated beta strand repeat-containing protein, partial [Kiritimatiellae bacterium]|nr:autotransporter-associated beta strand repeat-containing protein [Kiritimatiellia bacterium]